MAGKLPDWIANYINSSIESSENGMAKVSRAFLVELRNALISTPQPAPEPAASPSVIAAALAVIEADRSQTLTNEHVDALDIAIKIQRGMFKLPAPRAEVTDMQAAHRLLEWNRAQAEPPIKIGMEYEVAAAIARTGASS